MRTLVRTLVASAMLAVLIAGGTSVAFAAPSGNAASVERYEFDDAWCFDHGTSYDCTTVNGALFVTTTPDSRDIARITFRESVTSFDPSGIEIGSLRTVAFDRTVYADGGQDSTFTVSHTRAEGEFGTCVTTYLLKIVDYELLLDRYTGPGCN